MREAISACYQAVKISSLLRRFLICLGVTCALAMVSAPTTTLDNATTPHGARPGDIEGREWSIGKYFVNKEEAWPHHRIGRKGVPYISFSSGVIEGSPGCGRFTGKYSRSGEQLTVSAEWTDDKGRSCDAEENKNAAQILKALNNVRRIHVEPPYWHEDALLLTDSKGARQIDLLPMQTGKDLSELQDTFWHLTQLQGSRADFSGVVIDIRRLGVTFSTPSYFISIPFEYKLAGLEFFPAYASGTDAKNSKLPQDQQIATVFETALHKIGSYKLSQGSLTFFGIDGQPIMVLDSLPQRGIESRRWHIAKYRGEGTQKGDEEGLIEAMNTAEITFLNGRVEGSPTCGGWEGTYKLSGDQLTVHADVVLNGRCPPGMWAQSQLVVNAFRGDMRIDERDDHILLRDKNGKAHILLVPY